jgi:predicted alpha/beta hydrolase
VHLIEIYSCATEGGVLIGKFESSETPAVGQSVIADNATHTWTGTVRAVGHVFGRQTRNVVIIELRGTSHSPLIKKENSDA